MNGNKKKRRAKMKKDEDECVVNFCFKKQVPWDLQFGIAATFFPSFLREWKKVMVERSKGERERGIE